MTNCFRCKYYEDDLEIGEGTCQKKLSVFPSGDCDKYIYVIPFRSCSEKLAAISKVMDEMRCWNIEDSHEDIRDILDTPFEEEEK
jgi:hypothetical protein